MTKEHVAPWSNAWGVPLFGGTFFGLTGLHMLDVTVGVVYLAVGVAWGLKHNKSDATNVEVSGLSGTSWNLDLMLFSRSYY